MKKITKKILSVVIVISLLLCSSLAFSASAYKVNIYEENVCDYLGTEFSGITYYGTPGEYMAFDYSGPDEDYEYVDAISLDSGVFECIYDEETGFVTDLWAVDNGVALIYIYFLDEEWNLVDDYYALVVVSDGTDLGEVTDVEMDDVTLNYNEYGYIGPDVYGYGDEGAYYCTLYNYDYDNSPFYLDNDGFIDSSYGRGTDYAECYVIDTQGNIFCESFEIEVKFSPIQWIIYYLIFGWIWWN